jgi:chromosome segregation ATPase
MSDKTFGVKVSEELYDRVKNMIENSGDNAKEWFEKTVAVAELQSIKQGASDYNQDLNELEIHTARIYELISNMIQRSIYIKDHAVQEVAEKLEQRESIIGEYQEKAKTAGEELKLVKESLTAAEQEKDELEKQLESQLAAFENNQSLIHEYKEKIDTLSSLVNRYKGYADENADLKTKFADEKKAMTADFQQKEGRYVSSIQELKETVHNQQEELKRKDAEKESLKVNFENQLTQLTNQKDLEKERAILEVRQEYQEKLQEIHNQYNEKLAGLYAKFEANRLQNRRNQQKDKQ